MNAIREKLIDLFMPGVSVDLMPVAWVDITQASRLLLAWRAPLAEIERRHARMIDIVADESLHNANYFAGHWQDFVE